MRLFLLSICATLLLSGCGSTLDTFGKTLYQSKQRDNVNKVEHVPETHDNETDMVKGAALVAAIVGTGEALLSKGQSADKVQLKDTSSNLPCETKMYGETKEGRVYCLTQTEVDALMQHR
jgi:hypothetical protein